MWIEWVGPSGSADAGEPLPLPTPRPLPGTVLAVPSAVGRRLIARGLARRVGAPRPGATADLRPNAPPVAAYYRAEP